MTQAECQEEWNRIKARMLDEIVEIDAMTPDKPTEEPKWWLEMMNVYRTLRDVEKPSTPKSQKKKGEEKPMSPYSPRNKANPF